MNIMSDMRTVIGGNHYTLKLTVGALYRAQIALNKDGLLELVSSLDRLDLAVLAELIYQSEITKTLTKEQVIEADDIDLHGITTFLAENIGKLFMGTEEGTIEKK